jgi:hypothetical protein
MKEIEPGLTLVTVEHLVGTISNDDKVDVRLFQRRERNVG